MHRSTVRDCGRALLRRCVAALTGQQHQHQHQHQPVATAAPTAVPALGEAQASLKATVNFVKPKEETRVSFFAPLNTAAPVPVASVQLTLVLNQEADAPPAPVVEDDDGGKKKKKKKKK